MSWAEWSHQVLWLFNHAVLLYFLLLNGVYLLMSLFAFHELRRYTRRLRSIDVEELILTAGAPPVTVIVPAHNESATCVQAVKSFLTLRYPEYKVLFVNDGSTDDTLEKLRIEYRLIETHRVPTAEIPTGVVRGFYVSSLYPGLVVIDKEQGGKSDALNCGVNYCQTPLFCAVDADSLLERDALIRVVRPFLEDARTLAAGGIVRIANDCEVSHGVMKRVLLPKKIVPRFQVLEYLRAFLAARMGWGSIGGNLIISGAFGVFRRQSVVALGGYDTRTVGEDMELAVRLHDYCRRNRIPYALHFVPDPVAWTECPETLRVLGRQRDRWQRGLVESLSKHRHMIFDPRYGVPGLLAFPYYYFLEMLGPLVEILGYLVFATSIVLGIVTWKFAMAFISVALVMGIALSFAAIGLEELTFRRYPKFSDLTKLMGLALIENLGFRQLTVAWRVKGIFSSLRRNKTWGRMERRGFREREVRSAAA